MIPNCLDPRGCRIFLTEEFLAVISSLSQVLFGW